MRAIVFVLFLSLSAIAPAHAAGLQGLPSYEPDANAERSDIPDVYKWDLGVLVADDAAWAAEYEKASAEVADLEKLRFDLADPIRLTRYLQAYFKADERVNRLTLYASLRRDSVGDDPDRVARHQSALGLTNLLMEEGPVLRRAILGFDDAAMEEAFAEVPNLAQFRPFIDGLRRRSSRVLPAEAERVLSLAGDNLWAQIDLNELPSSSENSFAALMGEIKLPKITDENGEEVQLTLSNYGRFRASADREVRRQAVESVFATLRDYESSLAAALVGQAGFDVFLARARTYDTALEAYLDKDNIDPQVYRNLIATVRANVKTLHRYVDLRREVMGLDELRLYDLYVPMAEGVEKEIPYVEAVDHILDAVQPLGETYVKLAATALDPGNGWVDLYPSRAKNSGAFSASTYDVHPYIKMNYQDGYDDVSTLAHELGHALHSQLSMTNQGYLSWRYVPFLAEIASTCNEALLSRAMIDKAASDAEKAWLLSELAETIRTTIFRQTMFADFELQIHEMVEQGKPVTADAISAVYTDLIRTYYGPGFTIGENDAVEWAYIPHFYWKYYVYTYATGLSSGIALAELVSEGGEEARTAYLNMLRGGSVRPPLDMLRSAGVDLTKPDAIEAAIRLLDRTLDQLEELLETADSE